MSDAAIIAICGLISLIIGQIATYRSSKRNGEKAEEIKAETKVITGHVNSAASAAAARIDALEKQIVQLSGMLAERKETAALLAQAAVQAAAPAPTGTLDVIVKNTPEEAIPAAIVKK